MVTPARRIGEPETMKRPRAVALRDRGMAVVLGGPVLERHFAWLSADI